MKTCTKCKRDLPADSHHFHRDSSKRGGLYSSCKECNGREFTVPTPEGMKVCTKCKRTLPAGPEHFHRYSLSKDGYKPDCKECRGSSFGVSKYYHPEVKIIDGLKLCNGCGRKLPADRTHFYKGIGAGGLRVSCKECDGYKFGHTKFKAAPAPVVDGMKLCTKCQKSKSVAEFYTRLQDDGTFKYTSTCRTCKSEYNAHRFKTQRHRLAAYIARRRALELEAFVEDVPIDYILRRDSCGCAWCGSLLDLEDRPSYELDHVIPYALGGLNERNNLVIACRRCNRSKGMKHPMDWLEYMSLAGIPVNLNNHLIDHFRVFTEPYTERGEQCPTIPDLLMLLEGLDTQS